jgi:hypothetical protein
VNPHIKRAHCPRYPRQVRRTTKEIAKRATDGQRIVASTDETIRWQGETHPFIWECSELDTAVDGTIDGEFGLETLLYAIPVAPEEILAVLHAALARSYDDVLDFYERFNDPLPQWDQNGYKLPR